MGNKPGGATRGSEVGSVSAAASNSPEGRPSAIRSDDFSRETDVVPEEPALIPEEPVRLVSDYVLVRNELIG
jgi:hypothetical protein